MSLLIIGNINTAFTSVESQYDLIQDAWVPPVVKDIDGKHSLLVSMDLASVVYGIDVSIDTFVSYSIRYFIEKDTSFAYGIDVSMDLASVVYGIDVSIDIQEVHTIGRVEKEVFGVYSIRHFISSEVMSLHELSLFKDYQSTTGVYSIDVSSDVSSMYSLRQFITADVVSNYNIYEFVGNDTQVDYDLLVTDPVGRDLRVVYTIFDPATETITDSVSVTINGTTIDVADVDDISIEHDEDSYCWSISMNISNLATWVLCTPGSAVTVLIGSDTYNFIIDSRDKDDTFEESSYTITGRSPTAQYGEGSLPIHKTWGDVLSHTVLDELITGGIIKNITNWNILDGRLVSEGDTAISIVKKIAEADGGLLYTTTTGNLVAEHKYKVEPPLYDINNTDHSVSDLDDLFKIAQSKEAKPGYNQVEVTDEPTSSSSFISITEFSRDEIAYTAILKAVIYPFVNTFTLLTSKNNVVITPSMSPVTEQLTEVIEIVNGEGSVEEPILSLDSIIYDDVDLGTLSFDGSNIISEIKGTTLVEITYTTQYHLVGVNVGVPEKAQVYSWED